jgi:hypothetical protein
MVEDPNHIAVAGAQKRRYWESSGDLMHWDAECSQLVFSLSCYPTGEDLLEAHWRTLVFNTSREGEIPTEAYGHSFRVWRQLISVTRQVLEPGLSLHPMYNPWIGFALFNLLYAYIYIYMDLYNRRWHKSLRAWILAFLVWWAANLMLAHFLEVRLDKISTRRFIASIPFESSMNRFMAGRQFCITEAGYMGWVHSAAETGDSGCRFQGCRIPFVIRPVPTGYRLIGDAHIHGIMDSETPEHIQDGVRERIKLV